MDSGRDIHHRATYQVKRTPTRGGARKGAGRKAADGVRYPIGVSVRLRDVAQRAKFIRLGGSVWLRRQIDEAPDQTGT